MNKRISKGMLIKCKYLHDGLKQAHIITDIEKRYDTYKKTYYYEYHTKSLGNYALNILHEEELENYFIKL